MTTRDGSGSSAKRKRESTSLSQASTASTNSSETSETHGQTSCIENDTQLNWWWEVQRDIWACKSLPSSQDASTHRPLKDILASSSDDTIRSILSRLCSSREAAIDVIAAWCSSSPEAVQIVRDTFLSLEHDPDHTVNSNGEKPSEVLVPAINVTDEANYNKVGNSQPLSISIKIGDVVDISIQGRRINENMNA